MCRRNQDKNNVKRDRAAVNAWAVVRDISSQGRLFQRIEGVVIANGTVTDWG